MKRLFTSILTIITILSISCQAQTSNAVASKSSGQGMKQMLKDSLHLTDVQSDSVISIREELTGKIKQITKDTSLSADQKKEQIKPVRQEMKTRLKAILSKDQIQKLQQMQKEMHKGKSNEDDNN